MCQLVIEGHRVSQARPTLYIAYVVLHIPINCIEGSQSIISLTCEMLYPPNCTENKLHSQSPVVFIIFYGEALRDKGAREGMLQSCSKKMHTCLPSGQDRCRKNPSPFVTKSSSTLPWIKLDMLEFLGLQLCWQIIAPQPKSVGCSSAIPRTMAFLVMPPRGSWKVEL